MSDFTTRQESETLNKIRSAFEGPNAAMRTIGGIARHTGLPYDTVEKILQEHSDMFARSRVSRSAYMLQTEQTAPQTSDYTVRKMVS